MNKTGFGILNPNSDELDWQIRDEENDDGEDYIKIIITRSEDDCGGLVISDNLSLIDENEWMEGPGSE